MTKKNVYLLVCFVFLLVNQNLSAQSLSPDVVKQTFVYAIKGTDTLEMDVMRSSKYGNEEQGCVFFMFGGGFSSGSRDRADYLAYFNRLTDEGLTVVSIDYRLLIPQGTTITWTSFLNPFNNPLTQYNSAINAAVEDLYSATLYVINNKSTLHINSDLVILSGSSSGAISCLTADLNLGRKASTSATLPADFTYKGVISVCGAILAGPAGTSYAVPPAPTFFLHGTADETVPYNEQNYVIARFQGSAKLADIFQAAQYPYQLLSIEGGNHDLSSSLMTTEIDRMVNFIKVFVIEGNTYQIEETI